MHTPLPRRLAQDTPGPRPFPPGAARIAAATRRVTSAILFTVVAVGPVRAQRAPATPGAEGPNGGPGTYATVVQRVMRADTARQFAAILKGKADTVVGKDTALQATLNFVRAPLDPNGPGPRTYKALGDLTDILRAPAQAALQSSGRLSTSDSKNNFFDFPIGSTAQAGAAAVGLTNQLAVGATQFFVERARDELVLAYLERVDHWLVENPIIDSLLPTTGSTVRQLRDMAPRSIVATIRAAASRDLVALPVRATDVAVYPQAFQDALKTQKRRTAMQSAHQAVLVVRDIRDGAAPGTALGRLAALTPQDVDDDGLRAGLLVLGAAAREHAADPSGTVGAVTDPNRLPFFVAFLAHDVDSLPGYTYTVRAPALLRGRQAQVADLGRRLAELQAEVDSLRGRLKDQAASQPDLYAGAVRAGARALRAAALVLPDSACVVPAPTGSAGAGGPGGNAPCVPGTVSAVSLLRHVELAADLESAVATRDYGQVIAVTAKFVNEGITSRDSVLKGAHFRFLAFAANIAAADNADAVAAALRATAEPVGSYRAKRLPRDADSQAATVAFTLNGYVGGGVGYERVPPGATGGGVRGAFQAGVSLPVGFEAAFADVAGLPSLSVFVPVVDLGSVASFRAGDGKTENNPVVGLRQLVSPGAYVMFGITRNNPFSIGLGWQYTPDLRRDVTTQAKLSANRFGVIFGVDIPVFRF